MSNAHRCVGVAANRQNLLRSSSPLRPVATLRVPIINARAREMLRQELMGKTGWKRFV
jgi:hypothetical protein